MIALKNSSNIEFAVDRVMIRTFLERDSSGCCNREAKVLKACAAQQGKEATDQGPFLLGQEGGHPSDQGHFLLGHHPDPSFACLIFFTLIIKMVNTRISYTHTQTHLQIHEYKLIYAQQTHFQKTHKPQNSKLSNSIAPKPCFNSHITTFIRAKQ